MMMQDDADEVICLTHDSKTTFMQHNVYCSYNNNNNEQFPTQLFINIAPEWVDDLPQDIDGIKIYKMKCLQREWIQKCQDLGYFKMQSLGRKGLIGIRKVGRCIGNLYFPHYDCPFKLSAGGKRNTSNFKNVDGHKICFSCGHAANREWCKAQKMTEYCRELEILTIYHIGTYKCLLKPNTMKCVYACLNSGKHAFWVA